MLKRWLAIALLALPLAISLSPSIPASAEADEREIRLVMGKPEEMRFDQMELKLKNGEKVKLYLKNEGVLKHELMSDLFQWFRDVEIEVPGVGEIAAPTIYEIELEPGKEIVVEFKVAVDGHLLEEKGGKVEFEFGCFIKGHYKAGMKGKFIVEGPGH